jgi:hypothetical protein
MRSACWTTPAGSAGATRTRPPAIQRYFATVARLPLELKAHHVILHETRDPEVVIAEYDYDELVTTTGRSFQVANIQVPGSAAVRS